MKLAWTVMVLLAAAVGCGSDDTDTSVGSSGAGANAPTCTNVEAIESTTIYPVTPDDPWATPDTLAFGFDVSAALQYTTLIAFPLVEVRALSTTGTVELCVSAAAQTSTAGTIDIGAWACPTPWQANATWTSLGAGMFPAGQPGSLEPLSRQLISPPDTAPGDEICWDVKAYLEAVVGGDTDNGLVLSPFTGDQGAFVNAQSHTTPSPPILSACTP